MKDLIERDVSQDSSFPTQKSRLLDGLSTTIRKYVRELGDLTGKLFLATGDQLQVTHAQIPGDFAKITMCKRKALEVLKARTPILVCLNGIFTDPSNELIWQSGESISTRGDWIDIDGCVLDHCHGACAWVL